MGYNRYGRSEDKRAVQTEAWIILRDKKGNKKAVKRNVVFLRSGSALACLWRTTMDETCA